jgi:hypothetical protein
MQHIAVIDATDLEMALFMLRFPASSRVPSLQLSFSVLQPMPIDLILATPS